MSGFSFGPDGTSKCESCGEEFNSFTSYDIAGKFCNKCNDAKLNPKQELIMAVKTPKKKRKKIESADEKAERIWKKMYGNTKVLSIAAMFGGLAAYTNWNRGKKRG